MFPSSFHEPFIIFASIDTRICRYSNKKKKKTSFSLPIHSLAAKKNENEKRNRYHGKWSIATLFSCIFMLLINKPSLLRCFNLINFTHNSKYCDCASEKKKCRNIYLYLRDNVITEFQFKYFANDSIQKQNSCHCLKQFPFNSFDI